MKTIIWDVDDVLNNLMRDWLEYAWKREHPGCKILYSDITENPPYKLLGVSKEEYLASLDRFRLSSYHLLKPNPFVYSWFEQKGQNYWNVVSTGTPFTTASKSAAWTFEKYGKWVRTFNYVPSHRRGLILPKYFESKTEFLQYLDRVDCYVDDSEKSVEDARNAGFEAVLFPQPWNSSKQSQAQTLEEITRLVGE
jgi:hypothetical protein